MKNGLIVDDDGTQTWYLDDKRHRNNGPAIIFANGSQSWWCHGQIHRENDLPAIITENGHQEWWYHHGLLHRENGPAVINANGSSWWHHGNFIDVEKWIKDNNLTSWETWDDVTWSLFRLEFL